MEAVKEYSYRNCRCCGDQFKVNSHNQKFCRRKSCKESSWALTTTEQQIKRDRFVIFARDGFKCIYCGSCSLDGEALHADHIVPRFKGGSNLASNIVTACVRCNLAKGHMMLHEDSLKEVLAKVLERCELRGPHPDTFIKLAGSDVEEVASPRKRSLPNGA